MKTIDLEFECEEAISQVGGYYKRLNVQLNGIPSGQLDSVDVAKHIEPSTFIEAYGENELKAWLQVNYADWFETEED